MELHVEEESDLSALSSYSNYVLIIRQTQLHIVSLQATVQPLKANPIHVTANQNATPIKDLSNHYPALHHSLNALSYFRSRGWSWMEALLWQ